MISTLDTMATQGERIPRALETGAELDPGVETAGAQIAILRRKLLLANQTIGILTNELKDQGRQAAA